LLSITLINQRTKKLLSAWASCETGIAVNIHNDKSDVIIQHRIWRHNFETNVGRKTLHDADDLYDIWSPFMDVVH